MDDPDRFGHDPQVQSLRRIFAGMEQAQKPFLEQSGISFLDPRLRSMRKTALGIFEKTWVSAAQKNILTSERDVITLYLYSLSHVLLQNGFKPAPVTPENSALENLVKG